MTAPVHYEIDETLKRLRDSLAAVRLPADAQPWDRIALANREAYVLLVKMVMQAENDGAELHHVAMAAQMLLADWLNFITQPYRPADQVKFVEVFLSDVARTFLALKQQASPDARVMTAHTVGGHA